MSTYKFEGKKGRMYSAFDEKDPIKQNSNCPANEKSGTGPGSCGGSKGSESKVSDSFSKAGGKVVDTKGRDEHTTGYFKGKKHQFGWKGEIMPRMTPSTHPDYDEKVEHLKQSKKDNPDVIVDDYYDKDHFFVYRKDKELPEDAPKEPKEKGFYNSKDAAMRDISEAYGNFGEKPDDKEITSMAKKAAREAGFDSGAEQTKFISEYKSTFKKNWDAEVKRTYG